MLTITFSELGTKVIGLKIRNTNTNLILMPIGFSYKEINHNMRSYFGPGCRPSKPPDDNQFQGTCQPSVFSMDYRDNVETNKILCKLKGNSHQPTSQHLLFIILKVTVDGSDNNIHKTSQLSTTFFIRKDNM